MSRTIKNKLTGFTPSFDVLDDELGPEASKIFGAVWRYCQMENGVCFASIEKTPG
ncbi:MAG: hypothetical protein NTZ74_04685 [Chloroflexi bacterium]|nr:hypothetical protein [Chloroflexota bacterium]